jgi:hypothetical protein
MTTTIEQIQEEIRQDIELYYNLHNQKDADLLQHCVLMTDELAKEQIQRVDRGLISIF